LFASDLPGVFYFNEMWESQAALNAHVASSVFKEISGKASELLREPLEANLLKAVE
jgi:quinol monooxygenase YgiN